MTTTTTEAPAKPVLTLPRAFELLCNALNRHDERAAVQQRVTAYIKSKTGSARPLQLFHNDQKIGEAEKIAIYKTCVSAIMNDTWKELPGFIGQGDKRVDPLDVAASVAPVEQPAVEKKEAARPPQHEPPKTTEVPCVTQATVVVKELSAMGQLLWAEFAPLIQSMVGAGTVVHTPAPAPTPTLDLCVIKRMITDELTVRDADMAKTFDDKSKEAFAHAMSNGQFPEQRVTLIVESVVQRHVEKFKQFAAQFVLDEFDKVDARIRGIVNEQFEKLSRCILTMSTEPVKPVVEAEHVCFPAERVGKTLVELINEKYPEPRPEGDEFAGELYGDTYQNGVMPGEKKLEQFKECLALRNTPKIKSTGNFDDPIALVKLFNPSGGESWFITEADLENNEAFGLCYIHEAELGYMDLEEMSTLKGPMGIGLELDMHWTPRPLSVCRKEIGQ